VAGKPNSFTIGASAPGGQALRQEHARRLHHKGIRAGSTEAPWTTARTILRQGPIQETSDEIQARARTLQPDPQGTTGNLKYIRSFS
jgi:hypothetical protein